MTPDGRIVRAMVLAGGSAYAAYEVGVLKALIRGESPATGYRNLNPDVYVGTSGGAVNAAVMASQPDQDIRSTLAFLEHVWMFHLTADPAKCREGAIRIRGDLGQYMDFRCLAANPGLPMRRIAEDAAYFTRFLLTRTTDVFSLPLRSIGSVALEFVDATALISNDNFVRILPEVIDLKGIRESGKTVGLAATNWRTGELRVFANADMSDEIGYAAIQASAAFPGVPPVLIEGEPYVDGGYLQNTPLQPAIAADADELHVVFMDPDIKNISLKRFDNTFDVIDKLYQITQANIFKRDIKLASDINTGLEVINSENLSPVQLRGVLSVLARVRWTVGLKDTGLRQLTIHLYHPREDLGGALGLMNFESGHIGGLIAKGYADAANHDCVASGCILPGAVLQDLGDLAPENLASTGNGTHSMND